MFLHHPCVEEDIIQVRQDSIAVQHIHEVLHQPSVHRPRPKSIRLKANKGSQVLTAGLNWDVIVGLGGVQGREHFGPCQAIHHVRYSGRGKGVRCSTLIQTAVINCPPRGPVLFKDWYKRTGPRACGRFDDPICRPILQLLLEALNLGRLETPFTGPGKKFNAKRFPNFSQPHLLICSSKNVLIG